MTSGSRVASRPAPGPGDLAALATRLTRPESGTGAPAGAVIGHWTPADGAAVAAAGVRGPEGAAMNPSTWCDLASVTKVFTTVAVMALVHQGLDLDAPVTTWVPLPAPVPTLRDLLQHRTGLLPWQPLYQRGDGTVAETIAALPRVAGPGEQYAYSDLGYWMIGEIIAAVTGRRLDEALAELVLQPLGLVASYRPRTDDVATSAWDDQAERRMIATGDPYPILLAAPFDGWRTAPITGQVHDGNTAHALAQVSGHAGLFAPAGDLIALGSALATGAHRLFADSVLTEFISPGPDPQQGMGFRLHPLPSGERLIWHPGFTGTALGVVTGDRPRVLVMLTNRLLATGRPPTTTDLWHRALQGAGWQEAQ